MSCLTGLSKLERCCMSGKQLYIGVDLGGTNIAAGVVDEKHKVIARDKKKTKADKGEEQVVERIAKCVREAVSNAELKLADIGGVGIGAPGAVDIKSGVVMNAVNLRWTDYPLAKALRDELDGVPVTLDNDVNVGAWGEYVAGAARDHQDMFGIFVGTGIGGGVVLNGDLYHGHFNTAGEIGHTVLHADAPLGNRTLENRASRTAVGSSLKALILANQDSALSEITDGNLDAIRSGALSKAVEQKDELTLKVLGVSAHYVGVAIANTITLLSLPCAVVGGGLVEALGDVYVDLVRQSFNDHVFPPILKKCAIVASTLGDDAGVVGAADLARTRLG
jgi:glucokinase